MKLVHAADIHLDSPMRGLARYEGAPVEKLRLATRAALRNLVDITIEEGAAALLIAGDVFDGDWHDYGTGACFAREVGRLREAGVPVVAIAGNHDAASRITKSLRMPDNYRGLDVAAPETVRFEELGLAVHGQGFERPDVAEDLSRAYPPPLEGYVNVGLLHTAADGRPGHEPYAPCKPERLAQHGYEYWALGHVHTHEILVEEPPVAFSGCLQARHAREPGPKGALLLDVEDGVVTPSFRPLDDVRWEVCQLDAAGAASEEELFARLAEELRPIGERADGRLVALRVEVAGASEVAATLSRDPERLRHEVALVAAETVLSTEIWVEKVAVRGGAAVALSPQGDDAFAELAQTIAAAGEGERRIAALAAELEPLATKLPGPLRAEFDPQDEETVRRLLAEVERTLPSRLIGEPL